MKWYKKHWKINTVITIMGIASIWFNINNLMSVLFTILIMFLGWPIDYVERKIEMYRNR